MKKLIFLSLLAVMFVSCHRELRKSPDIRMDPYHVVTSVGETATVPIFSNFLFKDSVRQYVDRPLSEDAQYIVLKKVVYLSVVRLQ